MELVKALRVTAQSRIAFVGAGGKTTAVFRSARQVGGTALVAVTAHLAVDEAEYADRHFVVSSPVQVNQTRKRLVEGVNLFTGPEIKTGRLGGLDDRTIMAVKTLADQIDCPLLIEADGSRRLPAKAPAEHEPPIPGWIHTVVVTAGLSVVGKPLDGDHVFRPEIFSDLSGLALDSPVQLEHLIQIMIHPQGGQKNIPAGAEKIALFNQWDRLPISPEDLEGAKNDMLRVFDTVLVASLRDEGSEVKYRLENVAGVILAAGGSERFGQPKQLLDWRGKPFIQHIVEAAITAGLAPVVVIIGAVREPIQKTLEQYPIKIIINEDWPQGQASSIVAGVQAVAGRCGAAVFLLSDMPQVSVGFLQGYLRYHRTKDHEIVAPVIAGKPANPAMFDRRCFPALMGLSGQSGGRQLFDRFRVDRLELDDPFLAIDVDTPEDYQRLLEFGRGRNSD